MVQSTETTVAGYIRSLPPERATVIKAIRALVNENIPSGYKENMRWGMISWEVPFSVLKDTYNGQPLNYIGLAAQKNSYSLYLMSCYVSGKERKEFEKAYLESGKPMNIGKSCVRFKQVESLPIPLIKKYIKRYSVAQYIEAYENSRKK